MRENVEIRTSQEAAQILIDFANAPSYEDFRNKWFIAGLRHWTRGEAEFRRVQQLIRKVWHGQEDAGEQVALNLGLSLQSGYGQREFHPAKSSKLRPPVFVDTERRTLYVFDRDLNELIWLSLLKHSNKLSICANTSTEYKCKTPYLIKLKPKQRFCSEFCSAPSQKKYKEEWWEKKGEQWRKKRQRDVAKKSRSKSSKQSGRWS
jgi:hypothetical protein